MQRALRRTALFLVFPALAWAGYRLGQARPRHGTEPLTSPALKADAPTLLGGKADTSQQRKSLAVWLGASAEASWEELARALAKLPAEERNKKLTDLARWNPSAAMDLAEQLAKVSKDRKPLSLVLELWAKSDAEATGRRFRVLDEADKLELLYDILMDICTNNPFGIGIFMNAADAANWPGQLREKGIEDCAIYDPEAAAAWIAGLPADQQLALVKSTLQTFAGGRGGLETLMRNFGHLDLEESDDPFRPKYHSGIRDPEEGLAFGKSIPNARSRALYLSRVMDQIAFRDTREAMKRFDADIPEQDKKAVAEGIGRSLHDHFSEVWAWMRQKPEIFGIEAARGLFFEQTGNARVGPEHHAAFEELVKRTPPEQRKDSFWVTLRSVVWGGVSQNEASATADWIDSLQDIEVKSFARSVLAQHLSQFDPVAASEQIAQLPQGGQRDDFIGDLVKEMMIDEPERAFLWAASVDEPDMRVGLVRKVLGTFWGIPHVSVAQTITASALPPSEKQELLQQLSLR